MQSVAPVLVGEGPSCMEFSQPPGFPQGSQIALKPSSESRQERLRVPRHYRTQDEQVRYTLDS
jgi:hypothetical protein